VIVSVRFLYRFFIGFGYFQIWFEIMNAQKADQNYMIFKKMNYKFMIFFTVFPMCQQTELSIVAD
jgi:hypothetical protein